MLKRIGYDNLFLLGALILFTVTFIDIQTPSRIGLIAMTIIGLTVLIHVVRLIMFVVMDAKKGN